MGKFVLESTVIIYITRFCESCILGTIPMSKMPCFCELDRLVY